MIPSQGSITSSKKSEIRIIVHPCLFNRDEFLRLQGQKDENTYFRRRADMLADMNRRLFKPKFNTSKSWFNRIVGVGKIDIKPSGYVDLLAGYQGQNIKNPTLA